MGNIDVGDLVQWVPRQFHTNMQKEGPFALVIDSVSTGEKYHHRIRVMWMGDRLTPVASATSVKGSRISTWIQPSHFRKINKKI